MLAVLEGGIDITFRQRVSLLFMISSFIIIFILMILGGTGVYVYIGSPSLSLSYYQIYTLLTIILIVSLLTFLKYSDIEKGMVIFFRILAIAIAILYLTFYNYLYKGVEHTQFRAPGGDTEFIVIETTRNTVYKKINPLFIKHIATIDTKNHYKPFNEGRYRIQFKSPDTIRIHYDMRGRTEREINQSIDVKYK